VSSAQSFVANWSTTSPTLKTKLQFRVTQASTGLPSTPYFVAISTNTTPEGGGTLPVVIEIQPPGEWYRPIETAIGMLVTKRLREVVRVIVEPDADGYIARSVDFPLYGYGDSIPDAVMSLRREIESLHFDLNEGNNFTDEWLATKAHLNAIVIA
jgi:hypothetical protein